MQSQDGQPEEETKSKAWTVSDAVQPDAEPATRASRKTSTSRRKTSSSRKTTKKDGEPKSTSKRKTSSSRKTTKKDDDEPKSTAKPRKPKPKSSAKSEAKSTTSKRKTTKKKADSGSKTTASKRKTTKRRTHKKEDLADLVSQLIEQRASGKKDTGSIVEAILEHLTKNMGLSSDAAQMVVGYILEKLVKGKEEKVAAPAAGEQGFTLDGLFQQTRSGTVDLGPVVPGDEVEELARDAGLDPATTEASLGAVLKMLGESTS